VVYVNKAFVCMCAADIIIYYSKHVFHNQPEIMDSFNLLTWLIWLKLILYVMIYGCGLYYCTLRKWEGSGHDTHTVHALRGDTIIIHEWSISTHLIKLAGWSGHAWLSFQGTYFCGNYLVGLLFMIQADHHTSSIDKTIIRNIIIVMLLSWIDIGAQIIPSPSEPVCPGNRVTFTCQQRGAFAQWSINLQPILHQTAQSSQVGSVFPFGAASAWF
jgi:hypothetical protein